MPGARPVATLRGILLVLSVLALAGAPAPAQADALDPPVLVAPAAAGTVGANPRLEWTAVPRAAKYRVEVFTSAALTTATRVYDRTVFGTAAAPPDELPVGTLYWQVTTYDGDGTPGNPSPAQSFVKALAAPVPTAPGAGAALAYPAATPVLSWTEIPGILRYEVQVDSTTGFSGVTTYSTAGTSMALPVTVPTGSVRYWRVRGVTTTPAITTAWSDAANLRSFTLGWPAATTPALGAPAAGAVVDNPEFSWSAVPGAAKYRIQVSDAEDFSVLAVDQLTGATSYRPQSSLASKLYFWRVAAQSPGGDQTAWSPARTFDHKWLATGGGLARPDVTLEDGDAAPGVQLAQDRVAASWTPVRGATYYEVEISTDPSFLNDHSTVKRVCRTPHTSWTPYLSGDYTGPHTGTPAFPACAWTGTPDTSTATRFIRTQAEGEAAPPEYFVRVRAVDASPSGTVRNSLWSNDPSVPGGPAVDQSFTTFAPSGGTAADKAAELHPIDHSADTPTLSWERVAGAHAYLVFLATDAGFTNKVLAGNYAVTTTTSMRLNEVLANSSVGESYHWAVVPCSRWKSTTDNSCLGLNQATSQPAGPPHYTDSFTKRGLKVEGLTADALQTDTVRLSWDDHSQTSPEGGGFRHYQVTVTSANGTEVDKVTTDATGYTPINKSYPDGRYSARVRVIDAAGQELAQSDAVEFDKTSSVPVPAATPAGNGLPVLTWSPTAFGGGYDVQVFAGTNPNPTTAPVAEVSDRKYPVATLATALPVGTYSWRVRQRDAFHTANSPRTGPWSAIAEPFTIAGTAPALVAPGAGAPVAVPSLVFDWDAVPGAVRYRFELSANAGFTGTLFETVDTVGTEYAPAKEPVGGTTYHWRVKVLNAAGHELAVTEPRSFTATTAPLKPVATPANDGASINVTWSAPGTGGSAITGYVLRHRAVGAPTWTEVELAGDVHSFRLEGLTASQSYEFQVAARNAVGTGPFSAKVTRTAPARPNPPRNPNATAGDRALNVTWAVPITSAGNLPITGYVVRWTPKAGGETTEATSATLGHVITGLEDETAYVVEVAAENEMGRGAFAGFEKTTLPAPGIPDTVLNSGPTGTIGTTTASFGFSASGSPAVGFDCRLDDAEWEPCTSVKQVTGITEGVHTFAVRARDSRNRVDATPAERTFAVDLTAPDTQVDSGPESSLSTSATFTYSGTPADDVSRFECRLDAGAFAACPPTGRSYTGLAAGAHTFAVRAVDAAGNADPSPATHEWTVLPAAPDTTIATGPGEGAHVATGTLSFTFGGTPAAHLASFECRMGADAFAACTSPHQLTGLADGQYAFAVRAVDAFGQRDASPAVRTFTVDTTPPETEIVTKPAATTTDTGAGFTYAGAGATSFECKLDGEAFAPCPAGGKSYSGLAVGAHVFAVRGLDAAGNVDASPATHAWTIEAAPVATVPPAPSPSPSPSPSASPSPSPSATPEPGAETCKVPRLKGRTRAAAVRALKAAGCRVGKVKGPKRGVVKSHSPKAGATVPAGTKVKLTLKRR